MAKYYKSSKDRWEERTKKLEHAQEGIELLDKIDKELMKAFEILEHDDYGEMPTDSYHGIQGEIKACEEKCEDILNYTRNIHEVAADKEHEFHKEISKVMEELSTLDINSYEVKNTLGIKGTYSYSVSENPYGYGYPTQGNSVAKTMFIPKDKINFSDIMAKTDLCGLKDQFNEYLKTEAIGKDMSEAEIAKLKNDFYKERYTTSFDHEVYSDGWVKGFSEVLDFIPIVGGVKNIIEGCVGYTMTGEKLSTSERWERGILGGVTAVVDVFTLGAGSKFAQGTKLATKLGKTFGKMTVSNLAYGYGTKYVTKAMENMGFGPQAIMITHVLANATILVKGVNKSNLIENLKKEAELKNTKQLDDILKYKNMKPKELKNMLKNSDIDDILGLSDTTMKFLSKETGKSSDVILKELAERNMSIKDVRRKNIKDVLGELKKGASGAGKVERPSWRQSELDVGDFHPEYEAQKSFVNGKEVPYATKGSSRPDFYKSGSSIEVKNYNVTTSSGRSSLVNTISKQVNQRITDLPSGTAQTIMVDVRGQQVTNEVLKGIRDSILQKCNTDVTIQFMR